MPKNPYCCDSKTIFCLWDLLHKYHRDYLQRESDLRQLARESFWHFHEVPYPLDRSTAICIAKLVQDYVVSWDRLSVRIEEWVYASLSNDSVKATRYFSLEESRFWDLEALRAYGRGEPYCPDYWSRGEDFVDACDVLRCILDVWPLETSVRTGTFVRMPYFPLGDEELSCVPLLEDLWIDFTVLELCEACAALHKAGFARLPAFDPHPTAWHRFFPRGTFWVEPIAAELEVFEDARLKAQRRLKNLVARKKEFDDRPYVRFEDYIAWERRLIPGNPGAAMLQSKGLILTSWNSWIREESDNAHVDGIKVSSLDHPCLRLPMNIRVHEDGTEALAALKERNRVLAQIMTLAKASTPPDNREPREREIWDALNGCALTKERLAGKLCCNPATLFKPGGIKGLLERGLVRNSRRVGGYYRPDSRPISPARSPKKSD